MNRKLLCAIVSFIVTMSLAAGCNAGAETEKQGAFTDFSQAGRETESQTETESENTEIEGEGSIIEDESIMERFLNGEKILFFRDSNFAAFDYDNGYEYDYFDTDRSYSIDEVVEGLCVCMDREYEEIKDSIRLSYAEIDCGNDGMPDFALRFSEIGDATISMVVMQNSDGLWVADNVIQQSRSYGYLENASGLIRSGGSMSAFAQIDSQMYINGEGQTTNLYSVEYYYLVGSYDVDTCYSDIDYIGKSLYDGNYGDINASIVLAKYSLGKDGVDNDCIYTVTVENLDGDGYDDPTSKWYDETSPYRKAVEAQGGTFVTPEEMRTLIDRNYEACGVSDDILNGPEIEWMEWF